MNLIEKLGGYEKAKRELELKEQDSVLQCCIAVTAEMIRDALLEYRRQHTIFEVGDKVVVKAHPFWPEDYVIHTVEQEHIGKWYMSAWRHAEPEELEAGKRLEVNQ